MEQLRKIVKEAEDARIAARAIMEREIDDLRLRLSQVDPSILEPLNLDLDSLTCKDRFPSMYKDKFIVEDYDKEKEAYVSILSKLDEIREAIIVEAKKELGLVMKEVGA